jgi:hypothetical protein
MKIIVFDSDWEVIQWFFNLSAGFKFLICAFIVLFLTYLYFRYTWRNSTPF